jgi:hypothetical protein
MRFFRFCFLVILLNFGFSEIRDLRYYQSFPDIFWFDSLQRQASVTSILNSDSLASQSVWQEYQNKHLFYTQVHMPQRLSTLTQLHQLSTLFIGNFEDCDTCIYQVKTQWNLPRSFSSFPFFLNANYQNQSTNNRIFEDGTGSQIYTLGLNSFYRQNQLLWTLNANWNLEKTQGYFRFLANPKPNQLFLAPINQNIYITDTNKNKLIDPQIYTLSQIQILEGKHGQTPLWLDFNLSAEQVHQNHKKSLYQFLYTLYSKENAFAQNGPELIDLFKNQSLKKLWILQTYDTLSHRFQLSYSRFSPSPWALKPHPDFFNAQLRQWNVQLNLQSTEWIGQFLHIDTTSAQNWTTSGQEVRAQIINTVDQRFWLGHFYLNFEALFCLPLGQNLIYTDHYYRMYQNMNYGWENDGSFAFSLFQNHQDDSPLDLFQNRLTIAKIRPSAGMVWKWRSVESDFKLYWNHLELGVSF